MKIYLIERLDRVGYDEYDSAVIAAETEQEAIEFLKEHYGEGGYGWGGYKDIKTNEVVPTTPGIILESFNAG